MRDWNIVLTSIRNRVQTKRRLTLREGSTLLTEYERLVNRVEELEKKNRDLEWQHVSDTDWLEKRIAEWNELVTMLSQVLDIKVYGDVTGPDGNLWWTAHFNGKKRDPQPTIAAVYASVLKERLQ